MPGHDIIVVGASAGGVEALVTLARSLQRNLQAAVFVVLHIPAQSPSLLPEILSRAGPLKAVQATDDMRIEQGHIYIAPPDHHMLVEEDKVRVVRGPKENRHRPAIDPLFRSAALAYGPRVIGVILTGALDDGTAGLLAVKRRGGIAIVQDPHEALYPSMPLSALENVEVDYTLPLASIGPQLGQLANKRGKEEGGYLVSEDMEKEMKLAEMDLALMHNNESVGTPSAFSCPECGGVLWEIQDGDLLRFRCRVGHAFSVESVLDEQSNALEEALWVALKTLQESADLAQRLAQQAHRRGQEWLAKRFDEKQHDSLQRAALIRRVLLKNEPDIKIVAEQEQH
jgi:two-component system, chemotaxis family, protein-glutamate methylesterase/glutaminase